MLIQADSALIPFKERTFHCVVTSPPYWGLRKYSGEQGRIWGGSLDCEHEWKEGQLIRRSSDSGKSKKQASNYGANRRDIPVPYSTCQFCGAWYGCLGLEPTPDLYIKNMVQIMAQVHRVLRDDGVVWLNLGDCYAGSGGENANTGLGSGDRSGLYRANPRKTNIAPGSLMLMPHKLAIALQEWGWIVRNDVIWYKRNPMPESMAGWRFERERIKTKDLNVDNRYPEEKAGQVAGNIGGKPYAEYEYLEDYQLRKGSWRHTRAHEFVFMLTKKMQYWSNQEAVREGGIDWGKRNRKDNKYHNVGTGLQPHGGLENVSAGRNPRSVMDVPTAPYKGAHYATFPPNLIAPLIRATCPRWACPVCGQGWSPVVEKTGKIRIREGSDTSGAAAIEAGLSGLGEVLGQPSIFRTGEKNIIEVKEYRPTCSHDHTKDEAVPGICLDPFVGSGTSVMVARELLRRAVGVDISMEYLDEQAKVRTGIGSPSKQFDGLPMFD